MGTAGSRCCAAEQVSADQKDIKDTVTVLPDELVVANALLESADAKIDKGSNHRPSRTWLETAIIQDARASRTRGQQFIVLINKVPERKFLGIDVDLSDAVCMMVEEVKDGLVSDWNQANPDKQVVKGDKIIAVNGISGTASDLTEAMTNAPAKPLPSRNVPSAVMMMMAPRAAVKPKKPAAAAASLQVKLDPSDGPCDFQVAVDMSQKPVLGLDVDWSDGKTLYIKSVQPGAVNDWNREHLELVVRAGDRIVAVNGATGDAEAMVKECRAGGVLRMLVRTFQKRPLLQQQQTGSSPSQLLAAAINKRPAPGSESMSSKKRPPSDGSLYSFLPAADPEKDKTGGSRAKENDIFADPAVPQDPKLVIFLDIDGVLRKDSCPTISVDGEMLRVDLGQRTLDAEALRSLRYIVHRTGAGIVLSSEWRRNSSLMEEVATTLRALGLPVMRGSTAILQPRQDLFAGSALIPDKEGTMRLRWAERRAREITQWLRENLEVRSYAMLDDLDLSMADEQSVRNPETFRMTRRFVKVDPDVA
ncbi:unnamed protein product, partial [Polarella glacialis]